MDAQLPQHPEHLQELVDQVPESHKHYGRLHMRRDYLKVDRHRNGEQGVPRPCRYWSAATGNEVDVELYPPRGRTAIVVATLEKQTGPVLLGRAPDFPQNHFRQWHDDTEQFGWEEDDDYDEDYDRFLVIRSVDQPDWVDKVRRGAKYRDVIEGKQQAGLKQAHSAEADDSDGDIGDIPYEEQSDEPARPHPATRSGSVPYQRASCLSNSRNGSDEEGTANNFDPEEPPKYAPAAAAAAATSQAPSPANYPRGKSDRSPGVSHSASSKMPATTTEEDDTTMLDGVSGDHVRPAPAGTDSSNLNDLRVHFKVTDRTRKARSCRWAMCNTVSSLFDHALLGGVINRNDSPMGLWVGVKTGAKDVHGSPFGIARGDTDTFGELRSALEHIVRNRALKRTTVEISRA